MSQSMVSRQCSYCNRRFQLRAALAKRGQGAYCTRRCANTERARRKSDALRKSQMDATRIRCNRCCRLARPNQFYRSRGLIIRTCKLCVSKNRRRYFLLYGESRRTRAKERRRTIRNSVLNALGGVCSCCGESHRSMLDIDHVNGNGRAHRESLGYAWSKIYKHVIENAGSGIYQLLCSNCNQSKRRIGSCEHKCPKVESIAS